jgi:hypothetical protein
MIGDRLTEACVWGVVGVDGLVAAVAGLTFGLLTLDPAAARAWEAWEPVNMSRTRPTAHTRPTHAAGAMIVYRRLATRRR